MLRDRVEWSLSAEFVLTFSSWEDAAGERVLLLQRQMARSSVIDHLLTNAFVWQPRNISCNQTLGSPGV